MLSDDIHLFVCSIPPNFLKTFEGRLPLDHPWLTEDEKQRVQRYRFEKDQVLSFVSKLLMRWGLHQICGAKPDSFRFERGDHGKPFLPGNADLHFNLSHTDSLVVFSVAHSTSVKRLGVDVEKLIATRGSYKLANRFFSELETTQLNKQTPWETNGLERFTQYWTLKESFIKAMGTGLSMPLKKFGFDLDTAGIIRFFADNDIPLGDDPWGFQLFSYQKDYRIALGFQSTVPACLRASLATPGISTQGFISFESVQLPLNMLAKSPS